MRKNQKRKKVENQKWEEEELEKAGGRLREGKRKDQKMEEEKLEKGGGEVRNG